MAGLMQGLFRSLAMTLVSELGDETFIIAALLAMRHPKRQVMAGALAALWLMTIISAMFGVVVPKLFSAQVTKKVATMMFFFFAFRLFTIGLTSEDDLIDDDFKEVEEQLRKRARRSARRSARRASAASDVLIDDDVDMIEEQILSIKRLSTRSRRSISSRQSTEASQVLGDEEDDAASAGHASARTSVSSSSSSSSSNDNSGVKAARAARKRVARLCLGAAQLGGPRLVCWK
mmetsp:Transcript_21343/g.39745  ORF Transcript_21343/g.39745 Transcript_21343/m.39745 type:complete len:233 (-) Transcript_21343:142-840(-)